MNNKVLVGGLIGGVVFFLLGYLVYAMALSGMMADNTMAGLSRPMEEFQWLFLILGNFAFGFLVAYVLNKAGANSASAGAGVGAMLGFLMGLAVDFTMYGTSNAMTLTGVFVDIIAITVMSAVVGAVVGWWYGRGRTVVVA